MNTIKNKMLEIVSFIKSVTKTIPQPTNAVEVSHKYPDRLFVDVLGMKVWNVEEGTFHNQRGYAPTEISASPFHLANRDLIKGVALDPVTTRLISSVNNEENVEGFRRLRIVHAQLKAMKWKIVPQKNLNRVNINGYESIMLLVSQKRTVKLPPKKLIQFGSYCTVKGMKDIPAVMVDIVRLPAQNDGMSFIAVNRAEELWGDLAGNTSLLKIAGNPVDFKKDKIIHVKGTLLIIKSKEMLELFFSKKYMERNRTELMLIGITNTSDIWDMMTSGKLISSDNEFKVVTPALGSVTTLSVVVHDYAGYTHRTTLHVSLQLLMRAVFEDPSIVNKLLIANTREWRKMVGTLDGTIKLIEAAIEDHDEENDNDHINSREMAAAVSIIKQFGLGVDPKNLMNSLVRSYPAVIRRLTRPLVPGTMMYPVFIDSLDSGEIAISATTARIWGANNMHVDSDANMMSIPMANGEIVYQHRYPSLPGSLRMAKIRIMMWMPDDVVGISSHAAKMMAADFDGDKLAFMKAFGGKIVDRPMIKGTSSFLATMPQFESDDELMDELMNKTYAKNIGLADHYLSRAALAFGVHDAETLAIADQILQAIISSGKHRGDMLVDLDTIGQLFRMANIEQLPSVFNWLRGKPKADTLSPEILSIVPNAFAMPTKWPAHLIGMVTELNKGVIPWFITHDFAADNKRWLRLQHVSQSVVQSELYQTVFADDIGPAHDSHRFFLDDSRTFGPRLKNYPLRVLNWAYTTASNGGPEDAARKFDFDVVRAFARNIVDDRTVEAIKNGLPDESEAIHAVVLGCLLSRFWAAGFFNRSIVDAFTAREIWLAMRAIPAIAIGLPSIGQP